MLSKVLLSEAMVPMLNVLEITRSNGIHARLSRLYARADRLEAWVGSMSVLQTLPRSSDLQLNAYVLEFVRGLTRPLTEPDRLRLPGMGTLSVIDSFRARQSVAHGCKLAG